MYVLESASEDYQILSECLFEGVCAVIRDRLLHMMNYAFIAALICQPFDLLLLV